MTNVITTTTTTNNASAGGFGLLLSPTTLKDAHDFAALLAKSDLVPKTFAGKPGDILIAGAMGARLGLDIFSALAGIAVVNGRPTLWGDAQLAICQARPDWSGMKVDETGSGDTFAVTVTVQRKGHSEPYVGSFSAADAKRAGLWGKQGPWTQYPARMTMLRARAFALRSAFADAFAGFHAREEFDEEIDVTASATVRPTVPDPVPAAVRPMPMPLAVAPLPGPEDPADANKEPPPLNKATLDAYARRLHAEFGAVFVGEMKTMNAKLGIKALQEVAEVDWERAYALLRDIERALNEGA